MQKKKKEAKNRKSTAETESVDEIAEAEALRRPIKLTEQEKQMKKRLSNIPKEDQEIIMAIGGLPEELSEEDCASENEDKKKGKNKKDSNNNKSKNSQKKK